AVLDRLPLKARPRIEAGSSRPLESRSRPRPNPGVDLLIEQARGHAPDDRLVVLVLGAATDVASALLVDPTWADRVEIVAIGFDRWPEGGDPWNVKNDVAAWQVLLGSRAPIVVGDIAVTRRHLKMDAAQANALLSDRGEAGRSLSTLLQGWLATHGDEAAAETGDRSIVPVWDEVAVAYLLGLVETKTHPRPALRADGTFDHERPRGTITWVSTIDADRLWADLGRRLERAGRRDRPGSPAGRL
ncbi:MAG: nucleoside hydrolase, partial [Isosphaeraceae bacterium]|nr:nucleoside hydrolase [Isosphaeraceae bacterium]